MVETRARYTQPLRLSLSSLSLSSQTSLALSVAAHGPRFVLPLSLRRPTLTTGPRRSASRLGVSPSWLVLIPDPTGTGVGRSPLRMFLLLTFTIGRRAARTRPRVPRRPALRRPHLHPERAWEESFLSDLK